MKKAYKKPSVYIEEYTLSANVAYTMSCGLGANSGSALGRPDHASAEVCAWVLGDIRFFLNDTYCNSVLPNGDSIDIGCYNSGSGGDQIFSS